MQAKHAYLPRQENGPADRIGTRRKYYERNNFLISQYIYIDRLLDSSLPHNLIQEYNQVPSTNVEIPRTITEESSAAASDAEDEGSSGTAADGSPAPRSATHSPRIKVKRTPKDLYRLPTEDTPLLGEPAENGSKTNNLGAPADEDISSGSPIVTLAIYLNLTANAVLLAGKIAVIVLTSSLSVLASLVDAALDFLSTAIIWTTTKLISRQDQYAYPVGRRRLEPIGVLVFSIIIVVSFCQVALECFNSLTSGDHSIVQLGLPSIIIMASTVLIKFGCWLWCRVIKNSSVQALAQDAMTDVVFNVFSIIFPLGKLSLLHSIAEAQPSKPSPTKPSSKLTNMSSWLLRPDLVARCSGRSLLVFLRHHKLVAHFVRPHPQLDRRRRQRRRAQRPPLSDDEICKIDQADSKLTGLSQRRSVKR